MFEDSIFSSAPIQVSSTKKLATTAAVTTQAALIALIIAYPLLHPTSLSMAITAPSITLPEPHRPKPIPIKLTPATPSSTPTAVPTAAPTTLAPRASGHIVPGMPQDEPSFQPIGTLSMSNSTTATVLGDTLTTGTAPPVIKATPKKIRLSQGVSAGMLLVPIAPVYPRIAIAARQEGTVVLTATIDRTGHIVGLQATSGPAMLRAAAIEAVRAARYKPYLLNGEPTEVETTISVNFRLGT